MDRQCAPVPDALGIPTGERWTTDQKIMPFQRRFLFNTCSWRHLGWHAVAALFFCSQCSEIRCILSTDP
jgi:hypothetical protein